MHVRRTHCGHSLQLPRGRQPTIASRHCSFMAFPVVIVSLAMRCVNACAALHVRCEPFGAQAEHTWWTATIHAALTCRNFSAHGSDFSSTFSDRKFENRVVMARMIRRRARDVDRVSTDLHAAHDRRRVVERPGRCLLCTANPVRFERRSILRRRTTRRAPTMETTRRRICG